MIVTEVRLSSDEETIIPVRRLTLFELDVKVPYLPSGPYTYTVHYAGRDYEETFDMSRPRKKPDTPLEEAELDQRSPAFYLWREWLRWREALLHYSRQYEASDEHCQKVRKYILENCLEEGDLEKLVSVEDYRLVYHAALCPQVTKGDIERIIRSSFRAEFDGRNDILNVYSEEISGGAGSYDWLKLEEALLMRERGNTEETYSELPVDTRAILIAAPWVKEILSQLNMARMRKKHGA